MKKKILLILALALLINSAFAQSGSITSKSELANRRGKGNRAFGLGLNYTYPASGLSARFGFSENIKAQVTFNFRNYSSVKWTNIGVELDYCFDEKRGGAGNWYPFLYAGAGKGSLNYNDAIFGNIDNYSWFGWNVGGGLEWFPEFLGGNLGVNWKLGIGSYGSYGIAAGTATGLLYGGGFHYYFK